MFKGKSSIKMLRLLAILSVASLSSNLETFAALSGDGSLITNIPISALNTGTSNLLDILTTSPTNATQAVFASFWTIQSTASSVTITSSSPSQNRTIFLMSGGTTVTLPNASGNAGFQVIVKKTDSVCGAGCSTGVTISSGGGTLDGGTQLTLYNKGSSVWLLSDGTNWYTLNRSEPYPTKIFSIPGNHVWQAPDGIVSIYLSVIGAGASGTCSSTNGTYSGGGGGGYIGGSVTVTTGAVYTIVVGAGGKVTSCSSGVNGGDSSFQNANGSVVVTGQGGTAAVNGSPGTPGTGRLGTQTGLSGLTVNAGGNGGTASSSTLKGGSGGSAGGQTGGGNTGGNAGASGGAGSAGSTPIGLISSASVDSGDGGTGNQGAGTNGSNGGFPGSGGGGAWTSNIPGNGADGVVVIRY